MAANALNSGRAVKVGVHVVRTFIKLRQMLCTHRELAVKLAELEHKLQDHGEQIIGLIDAIGQLMSEPRENSKPPIGYDAESGKNK